MSVVIDPLTPDQIEEWASALEGGKFGQAKGQLRDCHGGFCCLGVLAELKGELSKMGRFTRPEETDEDLLVGYHDGEFYETVTDTYYLDRDLQDELAGLNDDGTPFPEIAKVIRDRLLPTETDETGRAL